MIQSLQDEEVGTRQMPVWTDAEKVLLVRLRSIGDTVLMTPCLEALKAFRPELKITVVSEPLAAPILEDHPLVDQLLMIEPTFISRIGLIKKLRHENFAAAFNMHGGSTASFITRLSNARSTIGFAGHRYSSLLTARAPSPDFILGRRAIHSVEQQLALLHWTGVPLPRPAQLSLRISEPAIAAVKEWLAAHGLSANGLSANGDPVSGQGYAIISPAAAFEAKQWATDKFAEVVDYLFSNYQLPSVIIAARQQKDIAEVVSSSARSTAPVVTDMSLKELMALISLSSLFVGNDSGPMHIAAACRRRLVAIFGSSDSTVWHPWTEAPYKVVEAVDRADAATRIEKISVAEVIAAIDEVIGSRIID